MTITRRPCQASDVPGGGHMVGVFLGIPLRHQERVIAATPAWILPADGGAGGIDRAAPLIGIEEAANLAEMVVGLAAHGIGLVAVDLGELLSRGFKVQAEVIGQPLHITLLERDQRIGTAIARTFRTIVRDHVKTA